MEIFFYVEHITSPLRAGEFGLQHTKGTSSGSRKKISTKKKT